MRFFENAHFNFIDKRKAGYIFSALLIIISVFAIAVKGLQYGIDFRGGTEIVVEFQNPVSVNETRQLLTPVLESEPQVREYGSSRELQIRTLYISDTDQLGKLIQQTFAKHYPLNSSQIVKTDLIGPTFAEDLQKAAMLATVFSIFVISAYIFLRFQSLPFALAVLCALAHDVVILLGLFTLLDGVLPFNMNIDQTLMAAFLTIIGYSLNDTIVVFDRIRENMRIRKLDPWPEVVNKSINQTLSRTVVTSLTTFLVVAILFLFGGAVLKGFSFALMAGIILGTYSTIFLACPMLVDVVGKEKSEKRVLRKVF